MFAEITNAKRQRFHSLAKTILFLRRGVELEWFVDELIVEFFLEFLCINISKEGRREDTIKQTHCCVSCAEEEYNLGM